MHKRLTVLFLVSAAISFNLAGLGLSVFESEAATRTLRLAHFLPTTHPLHKASEYFSKLVAERTNGRIEVKVFPANQLGAPQDIAEQVRLGVIDLGHNAPGQLYTWAKELAVITIPFQFDTKEHAFLVLDGEGGDYLREIARRQDFEILAYWHHGFRVISNRKRPINSPDDMKGLKLRVPPELTMQSAMRALGANTVQISSSELAQSIASGVVDGQENPVAIIYHLGMHKHQPYIAIPGPGYIYLPIILHASSKVWSELEGLDRAIIRRAAEEARDFQREIGEKDDAESLKKVKAAGVKITRPPVKAFRDRMKPAWDAIADYAGKNVVKSWLEIVDRYRR